MKTAKTGLYKVKANGTESIALPKRRAEAVARALREGRNGRKGGLAKVDAAVVAA